VTVKSVGLSDGDCRQDVVIAAFDACRLGRSSACPRSRRPICAKAIILGLVGTPAFERLIYRSPSAASLGYSLHVRSVGARALRRRRVDRKRKLTTSTLRGSKFFSAIRRYWPALPAGRWSPLMPAFVRKSTRPARRGRIS